MLKTLTEQQRMQTYEFVSVKVFLTIFYVVHSLMFLSDLFSAEEDRVILGHTGLGLVYYSIFLALAMPAYLLIVRQQYHYIKYIFLLVYMLTILIHESLYFLSVNYEYENYNLFEFFLLMICPIFVSKRFLWTCFGAIAGKYVLLSIVLTQATILIYIFMMGAFFAVSYIVLNRFFHYMREYKWNLQLQLELEQYKSIAFIDNLTQTYNQRFLALELEQHRPGQIQTGIAVMDIDYFKQINDRFNHIAGDQVLKQFAELVKGCIDSNDVFARYGGEEFVLILRNKSYEQCAERMESIRQLVERSPAVVLFNEETVPIPYTISIGMYYISETESMGMKEAMELADNLVMASKKGGRNRLTVNIEQRPA